MREYDRGWDKPPSEDAPIGEAERPVPGKVTRVEAERSPWQRRTGPPEPGRAPLTRMLGNDPLRRARGR